MDSQQTETKRHMTHRTKKNLAVLCIVAAVVIAAACYTVFIKTSRNTQQWVYSEQTVQQGTLKSSVTESGTVAFGITSQIYDLDVSTDDDSDDEEEDEEDANYLKVEEVYVAVGQRVQEGDPVYRFTQDSIDSVRKALTYENTEAQIALATAQTAYEIGVLEAELSRDETLLGTSLAQTSYDTAIARLSNDMAAKSLEIQQLLKEIYKLQCDLTNEDYLEEKSDILEAYEDAVEGVENASDDYVTNRVDAAQAFQAAKASYEQVFSQFDESNQQIQDKIDEVYKIEAEIAYRQQLLEKELLAAQQDLKTSAVSGEIADVKYQSSLTGYENALSKAQRELEEAAEKLDAFDKFVGDGTVCAEGSGIVTEIGYEAGDSLMSTGTLIA
ncbi:MAG: HlyD family secretion protein, partial [Lachnospiraceae bacterium]|nr:HlyD family secretion protein [Lachnospiraceae bacterium]